MLCVSLLLHGLFLGRFAALGDMGHGPAHVSAHVYPCVLKVLGEESYLPAALRAGELVWQRGLLKKGPSLCHGVSGNAYALARLYKTTQVGARQQGKIHVALSVRPGESGCEQGGRHGGPVYVCPFWCEGLGLVSA
jgi:hypothetical protein